MIDHDRKPGAIERCQICGSTHLRDVIDLGAQPPCDALLSPGDDRETHYPLALVQCAECTLAQLTFVVPREIVYPALYPYKAGISWPVVEAHREMAARLVARFGPGLCVDVGSNDGTLLRWLRELGCTVIGVEPTDNGDRAPVPTMHNFFSERLAAKVVDKFGQARIITFTNVFAHMGDLGEVMRGVSRLLAKRGVLVIENHYLLDVLQRNQFDTIYHEHIRTYTLKSLMTLFAQYGMEVFDVERVPRYGGNIRVYVGWKGGRLVDHSVSDLLEMEAHVDLGGAATWQHFRERAERVRDELVSWLNAERAAGRSVVGCSAPGRASSLLNYCGITEHDIPWTGELAGSLKIGKRLPKSHIEVVPNTRIIEEQPDNVLLLAWHYGAEIAKRLRGEGVRSTLMVPLPELEEIAWVPGQVPVVLPGGMKIERRELVDDGSLDAFKELGVEPVRLRSEDLRAELDADLGREVLDHESGG